MSWADLYLVALVVAWAAVSGFFAGTARIYGEMLWLEIVRGERKEACPGTRRHYLWLYPLRMFVLWPIWQIVGAYRLDKERRRR